MPIGSVGMVSDSGGAWAIIPQFYENENIVCDRFSSEGAIRCTLRQLMPNQTIKIGTHLGPYEVTAHLGAGGMGEVYRARDTRLHREVAIKMLPADSAGDAVSQARF